jgi:hypothetical protein
MHTTIRRLTLLTLTIATLAAVFLLHEGPTVVQLEPVHVTAKRVPAAAVVQLPLVEVTARRGSDATRVADEAPLAMQLRKPV